MQNPHRWRFTKESNRKPGECELSQEPVKTTMYCDDRMTMDAIIEYAIQKKFMSRCGENYHYSDTFKNVDEIVMMARGEGIVVLYEEDGICYRLTQKGEDWFKGLPNNSTVSQENNN